MRIVFDLAVRVFRLADFLLYFLWELVLANLRVAYDVVTPAPRIRPGIVALPLDARTDAEITVLASLLSLAPDTLALHLSADRRTLFLHAMFVDDPGELVRGIKQGIERRLLEVIR